MKRGSAAPQHHYDSDMLMTNTTFPNRSSQRAVFGVSSAMDMNSAESYQTSGMSPLANTGYGNF